MATIETQTIWTNKKTGKQVRVYFSNERYVEHVKVDGKNPRGMSMEQFIRLYEPAK
jgi:hypothetical protein